MAKEKKKIGCLGGIAVFILICIIASAAGKGGDDKKESDKSVPTTQITTEAPETSKTEAATTEAASGTAAPTENTTEPAETELDQNFIRPEFKEAMDSYEAFMNEYVDFMKKYNSLENNLEFLAEYNEFMKKYAECTLAFKKWDEEIMTTAESAYYLEVSLRIENKLIEASLTM